MIRLALVLPFEWPSGGGYVLIMDSALACAILSVGHLHSPRISHEAVWNCRAENEMVATGRSEFAIRKAIEVLTRRGELSYTGQRKYITRDF